MDAAIVTENTQPQDYRRYENRYVPVPPNGKTCPISGLKHAHLYRLLLRGPAGRHVRVVSLREPGATRGRLLYHAGDFLHWLDTLAATQRSQKVQPTP
jgi:hypothetical protein